MRSTYIGSIAFNQLHGECQTRIQQKRWCPHCEREVPLSEVVKGYEFAKGRYVVMQEDDFAKVSTPSTRIINLEQFTDETARDNHRRGWTTFFDVLETFVAK